MKRSNTDKGYSFKYPHNIRVNMSPERRRLLGDVYLTILFLVIFFFMWRAIDWFFDLPYLFWSTALESVIITGVIISMLIIFRARRYY